MISKKCLLLAVVVAALGYWLTSRVRTGSCASFATMQKFEPKKYMGKWFEIAKYPMIFQTGLKCVTATYSLNANGTVNVHNQGIFKYVNYPTGIQGLATALPGETTKLKVHFPYFGGGNYWLIDTDYTSHALVYSCRDLPVPYFPLKLEYSWILSRKPTLEETKIKSLTKMLSKYSSHTDGLERTDQKDCPNK